MSEQFDVHGEQAGDEKRASVRRRGLIAGAAALVAGVLAKQAAEPVAAGADGDVIAGGSVTVGTTMTVILNSHIQTGAAFIADNGFNSGAFVKGDGIQGYTTNPVTKVSNAGVFGRNNDLNGVGTWGEAPSGTGVFGDSGSGSGVAGNSTSGAGPYGISSSGNGSFGQSTTGVGVFGFSTSSYGVLGASNQSHGVTGTSQAAGFAGLVGVASYDNTTGLVGVANSGTDNTFAARFTGPVQVNGALIVGSGGKSAAAKHKDGTHRLLYCVEAPDSWFEDFGEGTLVNGKAEVKLDPEFAGVVDASAMHVFITEHDQHNALHVAKRSAAGFTVEADAATLVAKGKNALSVSGTFSYRVVAKRGDIKTEQLVKFTMPPAIKGITIPAVPDKSTIPTSRSAKKP
jgi:hypothetical protein